MFTRDLESVTFAVCSNRLDFVQRCVPINVKRLKGLGANFIVYYDGEQDPRASQVLSDLQGLGAATFAAGSCRGLSWCRNASMTQCDTPAIVFLDDEVTVDRESMIQLARALSEVEAAGVNILGPEGETTYPWFIGPGQLHYLGIHNLGDRRRRPWGACLGFQMAALRHWGLQFRYELGRTADDFACGDDTYICTEIKRRGGTVRLLADAFVWHNIDPKRLAAWYLIRRAYWQGRSEVRRKDAWNGFVKELRRNLSHEGPSVLQLAVGSVLCAAVATGIAREALLR